MEAALREHGVIDLSEVEMAVLEIDGSISVVPTGTDTKRLRRLAKVRRHGRNQWTNSLCQNL